MKRKQKTANDRAPMCPICDTRHYNREPHKFVGSKMKRSRK